MKPIQATLLAGLAFFAAATAQAAISINTVEVGDAGNPADPTTGYGSVGYTYAIGQYEVTIGQYTAFLNAVAATDTYLLYNTFMGTDLNVAGITRSGSSGSYTYSVMNNGGDSSNRPITYVSWFDAARFANWLANGQPVGAQAANTTENGAYTLNGAMSGTNFAKNAVNPNNGAATTFWIPSEDEWYKAAYYSPGASGDSYWLYPTQSDSAPGNVVGSAGGANYYTVGAGYSVTQSGSYSSLQNYLTSAGAFNAASHYGTYDQGGNAYEWNDAVISGSLRGFRGGSWGNYGLTLQSSFRGNGDPTGENWSVGFRVASVPEPSAALLMMLSGAGWLVWKRRKVTL